MKEAKLWSRWAGAAVCMAFAACSAGASDPDLSPAGAADAGSGDAGHSDACVEPITWTRPEPLTSDPGPSIWAYADPGTGPCRWDRTKGMQGECFPRCSAETMVKYHEALAASSGQQLTAALAADPTPPVPAPLSTGMVMDLTCSRCVAQQNFSCFIASCSAQSEAYSACVREKGNGMACPAESAAYSACFAANTASIDRCNDERVPLCFAPEFARAQAQRTP